MASALHSQEKSLSASGTVTPMSHQEREKALRDSGTVTPTDEASSAPVPPPAPTSDIPDGGLVAWLQVVGAFILFFNSWGIINTFGAFQTYYDATLLNTYSPSIISWIGSVQGFLLLLVGVLTGPIFDMGWFRTLLSVGSFMVVFGMMMTSISSKYYQVFLAQGVCVGLGCGCLFVPSVAIVSTYFSKKRSFAVGLAASGSSLGGVIYPAVFHELQPRIGFGWATRVIGFIALGMLIIAIAVMKRRVLPSGRRRLLDLSAFKEIPFSMFTLGEFLGFMGLYIPFFYISAFATTHTGASDKLAFYFVPILNAASIFGRIIPNFLADKTGPLNMLIPCSIISAILALCWIRIHNVAGLVVFAILYGFFSGTFVSLPPSTVVSLSPDLKSVGTRMGMSFAWAGVGLLIGNPIAGSILNLETGEFWRAQVFCGIVVLAGAGAMTWARVAKVGWSLTAKA
ncbi:MFS general substrate transporter [Amylostereum chailletii]|nr:MFS general substrate transporter [Amylostereum chailletii]